MTYPFVAARYDYGQRTRPALALLLHMAEGGGTVAYLAKDNPNKVSVHYVIERTGRIVQMLREDRISGSVNPTDLRTTDDPPFTTPDGATVTYGVTAARAVMERYWSDPNTALLSCEAEGFADVGPNGYQVEALAALTKDVRTRYPAIGLLGHRDFTSRKACPGKQFPWGRLGRGTTEEDMEIEAKHERWLLDGGPGRVTTIGAPIVNGTPDYTRRLALTSGSGDANRRYRLIERNRLTEHTDSLNDGLYRALASYALPVPDCSEAAADAAADAHNAALDAASAAVAAVPRR